MAWQVRHKQAGVFMGVNHGQGHYHVMSPCCRTLGIYRFETLAQIESLMELACSPLRPADSRFKREDFVVEEWSFKLHDLLLDEGLLDDCHEYIQWSFSVFPVGNN